MKHVVREGKEGRGGRHEEEEEGKGVSRIR